MLRDLPDGSERDKLEVQLLISRGSPLQPVKGYSSNEMHHNYRRAKELLGKNSDPTQQLHVIQGFWIFHLVRGQHDGARNFAEQLLALATREQRSDLLVEAHVRMGTTYFYLGRFEDARTHLLTAISLFDPNQYHTHGFLYGPNPTIAARIHLARVVWILGEVEYAETLAQEAIRIATELDYPFTMAFALTTLSWHYSAAGNVERTRELAKESLHISTQYSFRLGLAYSTVSYGWVLGEQGQEAGLGKLRHGIDVIQGAHANLNLPFAWTSLAELYLRNGRIDKGLEAIEEARELTANGGELFWLAEMHRLKGELLLRHSENSVSAAEQSFHEALKIARAQHATMLELRAATSLARFWRQHHKLAEATRLLQDVCLRFDSRVDNRDLREAKTVLQQLLV